MMIAKRYARVPTPVVLAILCGIAVLTWVVARYTSQPSRKELIEAQKHVNPDLYRVDAHDITKVVLRRGEEKIVMNRAGQRWQMTEPLQVLADPSRVNDIVRDLRTMERVSKTEPIIGSKNEPLKLGDYGLDKPRIVATLYKDDQQFKLLVGDETELGGSEASAEKAIYVKLPDQDIVYLVPKRDVESLEKKVTELRERELVTISRWNADYASLQWADGRNIVVQKNKDDKWMLKEPLEDRADRDKVEDLIGKFGDIKVADDEDFVDDAAKDLTKYGLDKPRLRIEVRKTEKKEEDGKEKEEVITEVVLIGTEVKDKKDKVYAKIHDQNYVVAVNSSILKDADKQANDLRSRDLVELATSDVDYVSLKTASSSINLGKEEFDWEIYQPKRVRAENSEVDDLVKKIDGLEIKEFIDDGKDSDYGLEKPEVRVAIYEGGLKEEKKEEEESKDKEKKEKAKEKAKEAPKPKGEPTKVVIGKRDEKKGLIYVKRGEGKTIFAVADDQELWKLLHSSYLAFRRKQLLSFIDSDVAQLTVYREGKTYRVERKKEKDEGIEKEVWRMTEPVEAPADSTTISDILWDFSRLSAEKFVAEAAKDLKPYGLDKPTLRATATLKKEEKEEKPKQYVLLVGSEAKEDSGYFAKTGDSELVFTIKKSLYDNLMAELREHTVLEFDKEKVTSLVLGYPKAKLTLEYKKAKESDSEKHWSVAGQVEFELDEEKPKDLVDYLDDLDTERFVQYEGKFKAEYGLDKPALTIEIKVEDETKTLRIGAKAEDNNRYAATAAGEGAVFLLAEDSLEQWLKGPSAFAKAKEETGKEEQAEAEKKPEKKTQEEKGKTESTGGKEAEKKAAEKESKPAAAPAKKPPAAPPEKPHPPSPKKPAPKKKPAASDKPTETEEQGQAPKKPASKPAKKPDSSD